MRHRDGLDFLNVQSCPLQDSQELFRQRAFISGVVDFLAPIVPGARVGPSFCMLVLLLWFLRALREFCCSIHLALVMLKCRQGAVARLLDHTGRFSVEGMSLRRIIAATLLLAVRVAVSLAVLLVGANWLSQADSIEDIFTNSVALMLILHLDNLLKSSMELARTGLATEELRQMREPHRFGNLTFNCTALGVFVTLGPFMMFARFFVLAPHETRLRDTYAEICDGPMSGCLPDCLAAFS